MAMLTKLKYVRKLKIIKNYNICVENIEKLIKCLNGIIICFKWNEMI